MFVTSSQAYASTGTPRFLLILMLSTGKLAPFTPPPPLICAIIRMSKHVGKQRERCGSLIGMQLCVVAHQHSQVINHQFRIRSSTSRVSASASRNSNGTRWGLLTRHTRTIQDKDDLIALHSFISYGGEQHALSQGLKVCKNILAILWSFPIYFSHQEAYSDSSQCMVRGFP